MSFSVTRSLYSVLMRNNLFVLFLICFVSCFCTLKADEPPAAPPVVPAPPKLPVWVKEIPKKREVKYFLGESLEMQNKEDALERAWVSALFRIGLTAFPETGILKTQSFETLTEADYKREFVMKLELIPVSPEVERSQEAELLGTIGKIIKLNPTIKARDTAVGNVLHKVICGTTVRDLIDILGKPDDVGGTNTCARCDHYYFWGTYQVKTNAYEGDKVAVITTGNGHGKEKYVCLNF